MPSNPIRTQTATALKNPAHSYRIALDEAFEGKVKVFEISEIENIRPQDLRDNVCVVVGTIQSLRVTSTEGRDVYAHKEAFDPSCKIEAIITVQALKEGWDCSFAYVFCSTANIGSSKDVEQLLGRVLRMPYARRRKTPELNKAYAHVSSPNFLEAAKQLETCMIERMGFEEAEAEQYIEVQQPALPNLPLFLQNDLLNIPPSRN